MKKQSFPLRSLVVAITLASSGSAFAAGFQLNSQSATGLGRAFAGDAVIADNASVIGRNAAAMSLFDRPEISVGVVVIDSQPSVKNTSINIGPLPSIPAPDAEIGEVTPVPNVYYIHPITDKFSLGAGIYSHFGTTTKFDDNYVANLFGGRTELKSLNFGLSASYRLNDQFNLGGGIDIIQGSGDLQRFDPNGVIPGLNLKADGIDVGFNLGAVYELDANNRFGLSYRYSPDVNAEIEAGSTYLGSPLTGDLILKLPDIAEFSGYHKIAPQYAVHYSVQWIGWGTFDTLSTTDGRLNQAYNWQDGWHFSLGGSYFLNDQVTLRAGYMYDTSAQDEITSISVPDSDRHWISLGATYAFTPKSVFDFGLTYLMGTEVSVSESNALAGINATTKANAWMYGVQYTYKF